MSAILSADDLNDFISPGAVCVKPPTSDDSSSKKENNSGDVEVQVDKEGNMLDVSKIDGTSSNLSPAQISLSDCLACSGCITSAEEILVAQHSHNELLKALETNKDKQFIASISHQSRASIATAYNISIEDADRLLINLFINQMGFKAVIGTSLGRKLSLINEAYNIIQRKEQEDFEGPLLSSICPGWVLYAEKTHPYILPKLSDIKSPQQITGCLLKNLMADDLGINKENIFHLSLMPCFDKKLESARPEKEGAEANDYKDVDCVLTAKELVTLIEQDNNAFQFIPPNVNDIITSSIPITELYKKVAPPSWPLVEYSWSNDSGSASGGYSHNYLSIMKNHLLLKDPLKYAEENFQVKIVYGKNSDMYELRLMYGNETVASAAVVNGFRNIQNLVRKFKPNAQGRTSGKLNPLVARRRARLKTSGIKSGASDNEEEVADASKCDYVEVMACPNGCINGGGQISNPQQILEKDWLLKVLENYNSIPALDLSSKTVSVSLVPDLIEWSKQFSTKHNINESRLFRTWFKEVEKPTDPNSILLGAKW